MTMDPKLEAMLIEHAATAKEAGALIERVEILHAYLLMPPDDFRAWLYARGEAFLHELMREVG